MMGSFVAAQNNLKRMSYARCVILFKTRQRHAVRFSIIPIVMKSPGLKPIEAQNARGSSACVPYLMIAAAVMTNPATNLPDTKAVFARWVLTARFMVFAAEEF
jgi:hypothetical protein